MVTQMVKSIRNVVIKLLSGLSPFVRKQAKTKDVLTAFSILPNKMPFISGSGQYLSATVHHVFTTNSSKAVR